MLGISHSLAHNPVSSTDHPPENNLVGQTQHLLPTQHRGTTKHNRVSTLFVPWFSVSEGETKCGSQW